MHQNWETQNIVVTGAASGLGRAICTRFIHLGASVRGIDINRPQLEELKAVLGKGFIPARCDVSIWEEVVESSSSFRRSTFW